LQDARDALERFKAIVMKGTSAQIFAFATAAGIVTGKEKAASRPTNEELGKELAEIIFPRYDWEDPQLRKRKKRPSDDNDDDDDDGEGEDEVEEEDHH
jgi:hypothetical protein